MRVVFSSQNLPSNYRTLTSDAPWLDFGGGAGDDIQFPIANVRIAFPPGALTIGVQYLFYLENVSPAGQNIRVGWFPSFLAPNGIRLKPDDAIIVVVGQMFNVIADVAGARLAYWSLGQLYYGQP